MNYKRSNKKGFYQRILTFDLLPHWIKNNCWKLLVYTRVERETAKQQLLFRVFQIPIKKART